MKRNVITVTLLMAVWLLWPLAELSASQPGTSATEPGVLERYIHMGLENNLALKQKEFSLQKSLAALREAKGMFLPSVSIEARYSRAGGGRVIDIPVGDLVNPMQLTLNQMLMAQGQTPVFPANIENETIPFLRKEEHNTYMRIVQPLFQPAIYFNWKIKKELTHVEQAGLTVFKRQLTADIKTAFFNYLKTLKVVDFLEETRSLLKENLRIAESLFHNHKRTQEVVFRAEAELSALEQQITETEKDREMAASYVNFLLNRPLDSKIETGIYTKDTDTPTNATQHLQLELLQQHAIQHREEFRQLFAAISATEQTRKMHRSSILPTVSAVVDYGFQGETYRFTGDDDYWMASLVLSWNLFNGGQDKAKRVQAAMEKKRLLARQSELEQRIRMQVKEAYLQYKVAQAAYKTAHDLTVSRQEAFRIVSKKYEQGMVIQVEYNKARNDYTQAVVDRIVAQYDLYIKEAQLERATAKNL